MNQVFPAIASLMTVCMLKSQLVAGFCQMMSYALPYGGLVVSQANFQLSEMSMYLSLCVKSRMFAITEHV